MRSSRFVMVVAALFAALVLAACGSEDSGTAGASDQSIALDGPASLAPAGSPVYLEASVNPSGATGQEIKDLVSKVTGGKVSDPRAEIVRKLEKSAGQDSDTPDLDFKTDVEPWLGERAGLFLTSLGNVAGELDRSTLKNGKIPQANKDDFDGAAVVELKDKAKADAFAAKFFAKATKKQYRGVDYRYDADEATAVGIVADYLAVGSEAGFKKAVDTQQGAASLADDDDFAKGAKNTNGDVLFGYVDLAAGVKAAAASGDQNLKAVTNLLGGVKAIAFGADVQSDAVTVDAITIGGPAPTGSTATMVGDLPGDSLLAVGIGNLAEQGAKAFDQFDKLDSSGQFKSGLDALEKQTGLDVEKDLLSWMGDAGLFVKGSSLSNIGGALVVKSTDTAKTKDAIAKLRQVVGAAGMDSDLRVEPITAVDVDDGFQVTTSEIPFPIQIALKSETFVIALGNGALAEALEPESRLKDTGAYKAGVGRLSDGVKPALFLDVPGVVKFADRVAGKDPGYAEIKPYLSAFESIVAGSEERDGATAGELVLSVKD